MDTALNRGGASEVPSVFSDVPRDDNRQHNYDGLDIEPIDVRDEHSDSLLDALEIQESLDSLPSEDRENHKEVKQYILDIIKIRLIYYT